MKLRLSVLVLLFLSIAAFAQKAVEQVRVVVVAPGEANAELRAAVLEELRKLPGVVIVSGKRGYDYAMQLNGAPLQGACKGVFVAVVYVDSSGRRLQAVSRADWQGVAEYLVGQIKQDLKQGKAVSKK